MLRLKTLLLARERLLERRELCEGRVGIGAAAIARIGAGRVLAMRGAGLAVPAVAALVAVAAAITTLGPVLALGFVAALVAIPALAVRALAAIATLLALALTRRTFLAFARLSE